jgi:hypothetical protein
MQVPVHEKTALKNNEKTEIADLTRNSAAPSMPVKTKMRLNVITVFTSS